MHIQQGKLIKLSTKKKKLKKILYRKTVIIISDK